MRVGAIAFFGFMLRSLLCEILEMRVVAIAFWGVCGAIAVVRNFGDDGCCDRFFGDSWSDRLLCGILEIRVGAIAFWGVYVAIALNFYV